MDHNSELDDAQYKLSAQNKLRSQHTAKTTTPTMAGSLQIAVK
jgi:hypothetical protein